MSVKTLLLNDGPITIQIDDANNIEGALIFRVRAPHAKTIAAFDRNQAHLLYLYLKERFEP